MPNQMQILAKPRPPMPSSPATDPTGGLFDALWANYLTSLLSRLGGAKRPCHLMSGSCMDQSW